MKANIIALHFVTVYTNVLSVVSSLAMKSFASLETVSNSAQFISYRPRTTLFIVTESVSPMNGDRPDKLHRFSIKNVIYTILLSDYTKYKHGGIEIK